MNITISDSELVLLKIIWESNGEISSNEILTKLPEDIVWQRTTVSTLLSRMVEKKTISVEKRGKSYYYTALVDENQYKISETKAFVKKIHGNKMNSFVAALCSEDGFTEKEIDELKELLNEM